jgi:hypothetical protein
MRASTTEISRTSWGPRRDKDFIPSYAKNIEGTISPTEDGEKWRTMNGRASGFG